MSFLSHWFRKPLQDRLDERTYGDWPAVPFMAGGGCLIESPGSPTARVSCFHDQKNSPEAEQDHV